MIKITSLFIVGASTMMSSFLINRVAHASTLIWDDSAPIECSFRPTEDSEPLSCNRFKLSRTDNQFIVEFFFGDSSDGFNIRLVAADSDNAEVVNDEFDVRLYPTVLKNIDEEPQPREIPRGAGQCAISVSSPIVSCRVLGFIYSYSGDPARLSMGNGANHSSPTVAAPASVNQYTFETNSHINSGVSVNPGDVVTIEASGSIRFGFFAGSGGPRGIFFNPNYNYFVDLPHGHLIGRVRQFGMGEFDGWFPIGVGTEFVVPNQGVLEFAVNDNQPSDNAGSFQIDVTIDSGQN